MENVVDILIIYLILIGNTVQGCLYMNKLNTFNLLAMQFSTRSEHGLWSMKPTSITLIIIVLNDYQYLIMIEGTSFFFFLLSEIAYLFLKLLSLLSSMWISIQFDKFHADFCWYSDRKCMNLKISLERNDILIITCYPLFWFVQSQILNILFIDFELLLEFFLISLVSWAFIKKI